MAWLRLSIETPAGQVDQLVTLLEQFDSGSISLRPGSGEALFDEPGGPQSPVWERTLVSALLHPDIDMDILLACVRNRVGTENILACTIDTLQDSDWEAGFRRTVLPITFGGRLTVRPSWEPPAEAGSRASVVLDPGLAFGTGRHPTTSLCLEWLTRRDLAGLTVIDYGCGSGILALAAARLGAAAVYAVDIDTQALTATRDNAGINGLSDSIHVSAAGQAGLPQADILVANILLNTLLALAPEFQQLLRYGGDIVLSGITAGQVEECLDCYGRWFNMDTAVHQNEWSMLHGIKR